ncbi:MAG: MerR family transcriptional regulator [Bacteroidia bacterium]|jgi:DNA-binding transcriptional MerR regulator
MPSLDENPDRLYYTIGEVADMFSVNASLIRFWEKEFDAIRPTKNKKGNRLFTAADIKTFKTIHNLVKERGYTLEGARQHMREKRNKPEGNAEVIDKLKDIRQKLIDLKAKI